MRDRIIEVVAGVFGLPAETVARGIRPDQVEGWDSERHVRLVVALEDAFDCMFEPEEVPELISLEGIEAALSRHVG